MIEEGNYRASLLERELKVKMMDTEAELKREFKIIDLKMTDLPA